MRWLLLILAISACKDELEPVTCPGGSANVDGICRASCESNDDCLLSESCLNQVCLPRNASEGPKVQLFRADRTVVTRSDPIVYFDYVVTNASTVDMVPAPGMLAEHAGTLELTITE